MSAAAKAAESATVPRALGPILITYEADDAKDDAHAQPLVCAIFRAPWKGSSSSGYSEVRAMRHVGETVTRYQSKSSSVTVPPAIELFIEYLINAAIRNAMTRQRPMVAIKSFEIHVSAGEDSTRLEYEGTFRSGRVVRRGLIRLARWDGVPGLRELETGQPVRVQPAVATFLRSVLEVFDP